MKKILMILVAVLTVGVAQAQDKIKKNTYILKGDVIEATIYDTNGDLEQTGFFTKKGVVTGEWISYDATGKKLAVAEYDNGVKVGKWFFWNDDKLTEVDYENSRIASVNVWKNEGSRVVTND